MEIEGFDEAEVNKMTGKKKSGGLVDTGSMWAEKRQREMFDKTMFGGRPGNTEEGKSVTEKWKSHWNFCALTSSSFLSVPKGQLQPP